MLKVMCFVLVASRFFPLSLRFTSTTRLVQLHHGSRTAVVWAEGRGGWWESEFLNDRLVHSGASSLCCSRLRERRLQGWVQLALRGHLPGWLCCTWTDNTLRTGVCQVRQHEDRQSRGVCCSLAFLSPPSPPTTPSSRPHTAPGTHIVAIPRKLPAALWSVRLRVQFSVLCSRLDWLPG